MGSVSVNVGIAGLPIGIVGKSSLDCIAWQREHDALGGVTPDYVYGIVTRPPH